MSKDIFDGLFDFDMDGKTDEVELLLGLDMMKPIKEETEEDETEDF